MTAIPDLQSFVYRHVAAFGFDPSLPGQIDAVAVGWLGSTVPRSGQLTSAQLAVLERVVADRHVDTGELGYHTCEICLAEVSGGTEQHSRVATIHEGRGDAVLCHGATYYVMPSMILHYVREHEYLPPDEFLFALDQVNRGLRQGSP